MSFFVTPDKHETCFETETYPKTFIDILYDHKGYLDKHNGFLGKHKLPSDKKVAIVEAGVAGLMAGRLLMKMGLTPVIYEAGDRVGGRVWSEYPIEDNGALFELGAMRVPRSEQLFQYLADQFEMQHERFPDPGVVNTQIYYQNKAFKWRAGGKPPSIFAKVGADWNNFVNTRLGTVSKALQKGDYDTAKQLWQRMLTHPHTNWSNVSFFQGLEAEFPDWTASEFALFGALGLGSGGFGPLYPENFAELARLIINGLETCQQFYPHGVGALVDGLYRRRTNSLDKDMVDPVSLWDRDCLRFGQTVISIISQTDGTVLLTTESDKKKGHSPEKYDAVIVATTTRSMEIDINMTNPPETDFPTIDGSSRNGLRKIHLMNSSKLFALTETKFWKGKDAKHIPTNIQTDELCRGMYCLDYPDTDYGVVLVSYTWGDDSTKLLAISDAEQRFTILADSLKHIAPKFFNKLCKEKILVRNIDWQLEPYYYGAFKLNQPGQDVYNQAMYYQFMSVLDRDADSGVYIAGDSVSWSGGWIEGALQTGMNAAAAVVHRLSKTYNLYDDNPLTQKRDQYDYGV